MILRGNLDIATGRRIAGWVQDPATPDQPVSLLISADGVLVARVIADIFRTDLAQAGIGAGRHSFDVRLKQKLAPEAVHHIEIRRAEDGVHCPGSPFLLNPSSAFEQAIQDGLDIGGSDAQLRAHAGALARQAERLLQLLADRRSGIADRRARDQLRDRWKRWDIAAGPPPDRALRRALIIDERLPAPGRDAGSNAILSHAGSLQRLGHEVTIVAADFHPEGDSATLEALGLATRAPPWCVTVEEVLARERGAYDLVYLHRIGVAATYLPLVRHYMPRARVVFSVADLHHLRLARQAEAEHRPELMAIARQTRARELVAAWSADAVITHSAAEAALLRRDAPQASVHLVPWSVRPRPTAIPFADRRGLAFVAHYAHAPNRDAALWLIDDIMPLVRRVDPSITCLLAGSDLPDVLRRPRDGVIVAGPVETLAAVFDQVRLTVAPLNFGAGLKGKMLDSLAAGLPCAATPVAAEGMDLPPFFADLVAADAPGLARLVLRLHSEPAFNAACAAAGLDFVATHLSEARIDRLMRDVAGLPAIQTELASLPIQTAPARGASKDVAYPGNAAAGAVTLGSEKEPA